MKTTEACIYAYICIIILVMLCSCTPRFDYSPDPEFNLQASALALQFLSSYHPAPFPQITYYPWLVAQPQMQPYGWSLTP